MGPIEKDPYRRLVSSLFSLIIQLAVVTNCEALLLISTVVYLCSSHWVNFLQYWGSSGDLASHWVNFLQYWGSSGDLVVQMLWVVLSATACCLAALFYIGVWVLKLKASIMDPISSGLLLVAALIVPLL